MNKQGFIEELVKQTGYTKEQCIIINDSLEDNFLFGKSNKEKTCWIGPWADDRGI